ncbi:hypothetical protein [Niabella hibiscisoli]|uniref:hypothetical protein n=1 Tax=Niabella hibiscisoli TaxID=1825928 RepID=UPI001F0FE354|nr:hypothetical protein [Niabella hibiscisoli]MCH5717584.1 hypothetical protein [Niabella hibiscisoli]
MTARKICYNGIYHNENDPVITAGNKSYRYGDGFFETIKVWKGLIVFDSYHQKRIEKSLSLLQYKSPAHFDIGHILSQALQLCEKMPAAMPPVYDYPFLMEMEGFLTETTNCNTLLKHGLWRLPIMLSTKMAW